MSEDKIEVFLGVAAVVFLVLFTSAIVLAATHLLFGAAGVGVMLGILAISLALGYLATLLIEEE